MSTEKDREVDWDCFDIEVEASGNIKEGVAEELAKFVNKHMKAAAHKGFEAGIQHARQGEKERLKAAIRYGCNYSSPDCKTYDEILNEFLEQEESK